MVLANIILIKYIDLAENLPFNLVMMKKKQLLMFP
jgi:hypothetical protein